jgi:hypothetical protein
MNRIDFQEISELRLRESKALLAAGLPDGAYYFPEKKLVNDSHRTISRSF